MSDEHEPIYYAFVQIVFSPDLDMQSRIAEYKNYFKANGFTEYQEHELRSLQVTATEGNAPEARFVDTKNWYFNDVSNKYGFILNQNSLAAHATEYPGFRKIKSDLLGALAQVEKISNPITYSRVGLRYLNALSEPNSGETNLDLLSPAVVGTVVAGNQIYSFHEQVSAVPLQSTTTEGVLVSRSRISQGPIAFPPDLQPFNLSFGRSNEAPSESAQTVSLDIDHYVEEPRALVADRIGQTLEELHSSMKLSVLNLLSEKGKAKWSLK